VNIHHLGFSNDLNLVIAGGNEPGRPETDVATLRLAPLDNQVELQNVINADNFVNHL